MIEWLEQGCFHGIHRIASKVVLVDHFFLLLFVQNTRKQNHRKVHLHPVINVFRCQVSTKATFSLRSSEHFKTDVLQLVHLRGEDSGSKTRFHSFTGFSDIKIWVTFHGPISQYNIMNWRSQNLSYGNMVS